jgi:hypothetical protein
MRVLAKSDSETDCRDFNKVIKFFEYVSINFGIFSLKLIKIPKKNINDLFLFTWTRWRRRY